MVSRGQERGNPRANQGKEWEMVLSGERRRYLYPGGCHTATVMGTTSFPMVANNSNASRKMRCASVI
jgi:hypothetical protein